VLLNDGLGRFGPPIVTLVGSYASDLGLGDFDRDGNLDAVTSNLYDSTASILLGRGDGTFAPGRVEWVGGGTLEGVVVADLDRDSAPDFGVIDKSYGKIMILLGRGDGTFEAPRSYPCGSFPVDIALGDIDQDRFPDLVIADLANDKVSVLINKTVVPDTRSWRATR
jgi:hypothetical protein